MLCVSANVLPAYVYMYYVYDWILTRLEDSISPLGTGVMDGCERSCGCWD